MSLPTDTNTKRTALKTALESYMTASLASGEALPVILPLSIDTFTLTGVGAFLIVFLGSSFSKSDTANAITQEEDLQFKVIVVYKNVKEAATAENYIDVAVKALTGYVVNANRADKQVYPVAKSFIDERNGEWWYDVTFIWPGVNIERDDINP